MTRQTNTVSFLHVTRPTDISSTPSQPPLACPTYTILIPLWAISDHAPVQPRQTRHLQRFPAPEESIPGSSPPSVPHKRTYPARSKGGAVCPCIVPQGSRVIYVCAGDYHGSSGGPGQVTSLQSCELLVSLKHRPSHPTTSTSTNNSVALVLDQGPHISQFFSCRQHNCFPPF